MNWMLILVVATANILGSFNDPFEFDGDYGPSMNPTRERVFELLISQEMRWKNATTEEVLKQIGAEVTTPENLQSTRASLIEQGREHDLQHGPTWSELVTPELLATIRQLQIDMGTPLFTADDVANFESYVQQHGDEKVFPQMRAGSSSFLKYDKWLKDQAARAGKTFDLPILSSSAPLVGQDPDSLKRNLLMKLFTNENLQLSEPMIVFPEAPKTFISQAGQLLYYWTYQALNLHLVGQDPTLIQDINQVKEEFAKNLGNPEARVELFKTQLMHRDIGLLFTQESDRLTQDALQKADAYQLVDGQNRSDGTLVFLRNDVWTNPEALTLDQYPGFAKGRVNLVLATHLQSGVPFILASAHGNSTNPEDGRNQISAIVEKFQQIKASRGLENLQLLIGIDANTKSEEDVQALHEHLNTLGLVGTSVGPTTIKRRMVTVQQEKTYRMAVDEEDYIITLDPAHGALFTLDQAHVGFNDAAPDLNQPLPNINNPSDHYPVWTSIKEISHE